MIWNKLERLLARNLCGFKSKLRWTRESDHALALLYKHLPIGKTTFVDVKQFLDYQKIKKFRIFPSDDHEIFTIWFGLDGPTIWDGWLPFASEHQVTLQFQNDKLIAVNHFLWVNHF